eukprot:scaffold34601_cov234-Amphora_coffeaeformis.AAC.20
MDSISTPMAKQGDNKDLVNNLGIWDVLMGRGAAATDYQGNLRLREIVSQRQEEYAQTEKRCEKHKIAKQIVDTVQQNGGRFLQCADDLMDATTYRRLPRHAVVWREVKDRNTLSNKVKQLLRDAAPTARERRKIRRQRNSKRSLKARQQLGGHNGDTKDTALSVASSHDTFSAKPASVPVGFGFQEATISPWQHPTAPICGPHSQTKELESLVEAVPAQVLVQALLSPSNNAGDMSAGLLKLLQQQDRVAQQQRKEQQAADNNQEISKLISALLSGNTASPPPPPPPTVDPSTILEVALIQYLVAHLNGLTSNQTGTAFLRQQFQSNPPPQQQQRRAEASRLSQAEQCLQNLVSPSSVLPNNQAVDQLILQALQQCTQTNE